VQIEMTPEQRELIEEFGLLHEQMGGTRMTGRVSGWLLLCAPPVQSLTEIAEGLRVSKAAVSGAARLLLQSRVVERVGEPGQRGDFYRALPADSEGVLPLDHVRTLHRLIERSLRTVAGRDQTQSNYALMCDLLELTTFLEAELPALLARWREHRASLTSTSSAAAGGRSPAPDGGTP
jgi:DNA-binding transcriptional regulator GbsR (MarR family)